jgi:hypothetical protein
VREAPHAQLIAAFHVEIATPESPRLSPDVVARERVTPSDQICITCRDHYQNTSVHQFAHDLAENDIVILLRDPEDARVVGFSTWMKTITIENRNVVASFQATMIIARGIDRPRAAVTTVFREADRIRKDAPDTLFYWFLISAGYKTWRYLPTFFVAYAPHPDVHPSPFDRQVLQTLAAKKFGDDYHADAGIVRFRRANPLRPGVAEVTERRLRDPLVEFFIRLNPGHAHGDELACLVPIRRSNLTPAGLRMLKAGLQE